MNEGRLAGLPALNQPVGGIVRDPPPVIDFIGDSITALGVTTTPRLRTGPVSFTSKSWYAWASMQSKGGFVVGGVYGLSGVNADNLVSQYMPDLIGDPSPIRSGYCHILIGTNGGAASAIRENIDSIKRMVEMLIEAGIEPIIGVPPPKSSFQTEKFGNFLRLYCQQNGFKCVDYPMDPRLVHNNTGAFLTGLTDDGIHPNDVGAPVMGTILYEHLLDWGILRNKPLMVMNGSNDTLVWAGNALLMSDTDEDGVPNGWTLTGAGATSTLAPISSSIGLGNEMTVTRASAATTMKSNGSLTRPSSLLTATARYQVTVAGTSPSVTLRPLEQGSTPLLEMVTTQDVPAGYVLTGFVNALPGVAGGAGNQVYSSVLITSGDGTAVKVSQATIYDLESPAGQSIFPF